MSTHALTVFGTARGRPVLNFDVDPGRTSPQGVACCRDLIARLSGGEEAVDVPFPLVPESAQRLVRGVPFLGELDDVCRRVFERVEEGWPGHVFSVMDVKRPRNRRLAAGVLMPYDRLEDLFELMDAGKTGERLATGVVIPDDESAEAHDAFGELLQVMLTAGLAQRIGEPEDGPGPGIDSFSPHDVLDARPALFLDVRLADSEEFAGRLVSFASHYALALLRG